jgi:hypothetical protein
MQFAKESVVTQEWVWRFTALGRTVIVPFTLARSSIYFLLICALFVWAYNLGQVAAGQQIEYGSYLCYTEGCHAIKEGTRIVWECPVTNSSNNPFELPKHT